MGRVNWIIQVNPVCSQRSSYGKKKKKIAGKSDSAFAEWCLGERERSEDAMLLSLKMEEGP